MPDAFSGVFKLALDGIAQFALLGLPYDAGSSYRPGARLAPQAIRALSSSLNACTEDGLDLSQLRASDRGDLALSNRVHPAFSAIETALGTVLEAGTVPLVLGGDHSVTFPCFKATLARHPGLRLLYLDAHPDLYDRYDGDPSSHACVVRRVLELDGMEGKRITQVGIRATTPEQRACARQHGIRTVPAWEVERFVYASDDPVYLSFDIDVLDPAFAPGCGNPVPGGLSSRQALSLIQTLKIPVVALDVVEVNPLLDPSGITALAAARVVVELLGSIVRSQA